MRMPLLLADFIYSRDCKLNLRKKVDTTKQYTGQKKTRALCCGTILKFTRKTHADVKAYSLTNCMLAYDATTVSTVLYKI